MRVEGKVALVTGGASGLGRATVDTLHGAGASLVVCDLSTSTGAEVADGLGERAAFAPTDVTSEEDVGAAVSLAVERFGGLHVAVSCAGIAWAQRTVTRDGPHDFQAFRSVVEVNLIGTFNVIRLAAAAISKSEPFDSEGSRGVIIQTASIAGFEGQIGQIAYGAAKGGIISMTLIAARDLSAVGIRVNTIAPGTINTPAYGQAADKLEAYFGPQVPHPKRMGRSDEYAQLALAIAENDYLNGEVIRLDGALRFPPK